MGIFAFSLGLGLGILLIALQQLRLNRHLRDLLFRLESKELPRDRPTSHFNMTSRLMMAVGQHRQERVQLKQLLDQVQQLIAHAPMAYLQVDQDNYLIWCNIEASQLVQITPPALDNPRLLLEQVRSYELDRLIEKTRKQQQPHQRRWVLNAVKPDPLNPDPQQSVHLVGYGIPLPEGQVGVFLKNEQELFQLAQQRDRWVSDVAHELKTPLTSIRLVAEMLEERVEPNHKPWMKRLLGEVMHLSNLVHDLLDLNVLEQRSPNSLRINQLDLVALINNAWQSLEPISNTKSIQLNYHGPEKASLEADQSRFYRVILNLLDNAIKYSPNASNITVCLKQSDGNGTSSGISSTYESVQAQPARSLVAGPDSHSRTSFPPNPAASFQTAPPPISNSGTAEPTAPHFIIDIIDQGPGFPEAALAQIFERFYRADPARARPSNNPPATAERQGQTTPTFKSSLSEHRGTGSCGLGLAIVRQIIVAHGGTVTAQNHPETWGAWMQIKVPMTQAK